MKNRLILAMVLFAGISLLSALGLPKGMPKDVSKATTDVATLTEAAEKAILMTKPLPVFSTYDDAALNRFDSLEFAKRLSKWNLLPFEYDLYQVVQIVVPNDDLQAYESRMVTVGKTGRDDCLAAMKTALGELPVALKPRASARCLGTREEIGQADENSGEPELYEVYEGKDDVNLVTQTFSELNSLYAGLSPTTGNVFRRDRKYDFNKNGYLVSAQSIPSNYDKKSPVARKAEEKPEFLSGGEYSNATVNGGVVCGFEFQIGDAAFYEDDATVGQVGVGNGDKDIPKCYKLAAGSMVYAQKYARTLGIETYRVSYYLQKGATRTQTEGTTLPENVVFNEKKKKSASAFKK
jgi:hypothetical protein